jgi:2'-phosphotransferase
MNNNNNNNNSDNDNDNNTCDDKLRLSKKLDKASHKLIQLLRHKLIEINLIPDTEGYVLLDDLLNSNQSLRTLTLDDIKLIVETSDKQRFNLINRNGIYLIRANQGHSECVGNYINPEDAMKLIQVPIENVFHGTYLEYEESIKKSGLLPMSRKHIHIAKSLDAKSGKRKDCTLLVYVDMKTAMNNNIKFYESTNGVILTEGPLTPNYLSFQSI